MLMNLNIYPKNYELCRVEYRPQTGNRYYVIGVFKSLSTAYKATPCLNFARWARTENSGEEEYVSPCLNLDNEIGCVYYRIRY